MTQNDSQITTIRLLQRSQNAPIKNETLLYTPSFWTPPKKLREGAIIGMSTFFNVLSCFNILVKRVERVTAMHDEHQPPAVIRHPVRVMASCDSSDFSERSCATNALSKCHTCEPTKYIKSKTQPKQRNYNNLSQKTIVQRSCWNITL